MSDWTAGYVADIGYTFGYYTELNPLRGKLAFLKTGLQYPEVKTACELGFGQGMSTNLHAAASGVEWYGTDFNPAQAAFAQEVAAVSGAKAHLYDQAFDEFCGRSDLPDFDFIGLHGIWSWVNDENRHIIVDFVRRKLKVGGVLYLSYNTQPGWAATVPLRDLLTEHSDVMGASGQGIVKRIDDSIDFVQRMLDTKPLFAIANPQVVERMAKLKEQDRNYLAHEYFNRDWCPMPFSSAARWFKPAKLSFACSAVFLDHLDVVNLTPAQQTMLKEVPDPMFRETVRDFMVNQQFRRDYWVRGPRTMVQVERHEALKNLRMVLAKPRSAVVLSVTGQTGEIKLAPEVYDAVLDVMADYQPRTLGQIQAALPQLSLPQLVEAAVVLAGVNALMAAQDDEAIAAAMETSRRINAWAIQKSRGNNDLGYMASPVLGGGFSVGRFLQLFLLARSHGKTTPDQWALFAWDVMCEHGQRIIKDGKTLDADEDCVAELKTQAKAFADLALPILVALKVTD
jgi:SAM-dependent methyltransferase